MTAVPFSVNVAVFVLCAALVWAAGTWLSRAVDVLAERHGWGRAFVGVLLLGGITSLPEIVVTLTASFTGNAPLAVNNLLGGVAMQVTILALVDVLVGRKAISTVGGASEEILEGVLLVIALSVAACGVVVGPVAVLGLDPWAATALGVVTLGLYLIKRYESAPQWIPVGLGGLVVPPRAPDEPSPPGAGNGARRVWLRSLPDPHLIGTVVSAGAVILVAGLGVALTGDALAVQTGLSAGFVGAFFVAVATSLPEVSTTVEAVRLRQPRMAFSNIFGTNLFDVGLLGVADLAYPGPPVLADVGPSAAFAALLGIVLTAVYLIGIVERRDTTVFRMGWDSLVVIGLYIGGVAVLYGL